MILYGNAVIGNWTVARELHGVRDYAVASAAVHTALSAPILATVGDEAMAAMTPMRRVGRHGQRGMRSRKPGIRLGESQFVEAPACAKGRTSWVT